MSKCIDLDDQRPHLVLITLDGIPHVIPVSFFEDVIAGKTWLTSLEDYEKIIPVIIQQWLESLPNNSK